MIELPSPYRVARQAPRRGAGGEVIMMNPGSASNHYGSCRFILAAGCGMA